MCWTQDFSSASIPFIQVLERPQDGVCPQLPWRGGSVLSFPTMGQIHSLSRFLWDLNHGPAERWQLILVLSTAGASWGSTFGGPGRCSSVLTSGLALPSPEGSEGQTCCVWAGLSSASACPGKSKPHFLSWSFPEGFNPDSKSCFGQMLFLQEDFTFSRCQ